MRAGNRQEQANVSEWTESSIYNSLLSARVLLWWADWQLLWYLKNSPHRTSSVQRDVWPSHGLRLACYKIMKANYVTECNVQITFLQQSIRCGNWELKGQITEKSFSHSNSYVCLSWDVSYFGEWHIWCTLLFHFGGQQLGRTRH